MAEATALRSNATPYPVYGAPWTVVFPMLDADGDLVTGASTPDAEVSKNGDTFADCTNESTEIATNSGMYYLTLTATEMTADVVAVIAKSATVGMKTTPIVLYPAKLVQLRSGTVGANAADGSTLQLDSSASAVDDFYNGCLLVGTLDSNVEARIITDYTGSSKVCAVTPNFVTTPDNNDTFVVYQPWGRQFADGNTQAFGGVAGTFSSGRPEVNTTHIAGSSVSTASAQIGVNVVNAGGTAWASGSITAAVIATGAIDADAIADNAIDAGAIAADAITAAKIANGAIDAATFAADVDAEILSYIVDDATRIDASALNTATVTTIPAILVDTGTTLDGKIDTIDTVVDAILVDTGTTLDGKIDAIDTVVDAIKASTDNLPSDPADQSLIIAATNSLATLIGDVPTNAELATALGTADDAVLAAVATVDGNVDAIKAKTDSLTFTVAGQVDANIESVNGTTVTGSGTEVDPWGP